MKAYAYFSFIKARLELACTAHVMQSELPVVALVHQARVNELAHKVGRHLAGLTLLLKLLHLLSEIVDLNQFCLVFSFLLSCRFLLGLYLGLSSSPFAAHFEHIS